MKKTIEVVAAIIKNEHHFLAVQRPASKFPYISQKWEFPGGKVQNEESQQDAIIREVQEELSITIRDPELFITVNHSYPDFNIIMHCFICEYQTKDITLNEHIDKHWLLAQDLLSLDWAAADIPVVKKIIEAYR